MMHAYIKDMSGCEYYFADDMFINIPWFTCLHFIDSMSNGVEKSSLISADIVNKIPCAEIYNHHVCVFKVKPRNLLSNYFTCLIHLFANLYQALHIFLPLIMKSMEVTKEYAGCLMQAGPFKLRVSDVDVFIYLT